jgi:hypothetical protein
LFAFEIPPGWVVQPTAKAERIVISPRAVFLNIFILCSSFRKNDSREGPLDITLGLAGLAYFVFVGAALAVGAGDAAAGDGLATGLGLVVAGGAVVSLAGEGAEAAGDDVGVEEFELVAGSHAAANAITTIVVSSSAVRLIDFAIGLFIGFASFEQD